MNDPCGSLPIQDVLSVYDSVIYMAKEMDEVSEDKCLSVVKAVGVKN